MPSQSRSRVTACIPCYNRAAALPRAIAALRAQTSSITELVVIDDGSTDGSFEVASRLADRVLRNETNLGRGFSRARALREIESDYVLFGDAGIALAPDFLECALGWVEEANVAAVFGGLAQPTADKRAVTRWRGRHLFKTGKITEVNRKALLATHGALIHRERALAAGNFDSRLRAGEDVDLGRRLLAAGFEVIFDPALSSLAIEEDGFVQLLERYARWNTAPDSRPTVPEYLRLIAHAAKVMAAEDLARRDISCALISLIVPHFQFWRARFRK
jgi:glycosyltransferase involved in cell wall biosynthesis